MARQRKCCRCPRPSEVDSDGRGEKLLLLLRGRLGGVVRIICNFNLHQEKKSASGRTGCVRMHQALGTLWTHPGRAHTAPNAKRTGNVNSDAARHGTVHSDAARHGICLPGAACQGIFLLDAAVSGHFSSGRSRVRAFSFWTQLCQDILLLDAATSVHFPSGRSRVGTNGVRTTRVMAPRSRWLSRDRTSQQILSSHSQTHSGFPA